MTTVYFDEAGTSAPEPVTVVVGIGVDSDATQRDIRAALDGVVRIVVPEALRDGFVFHANDIWRSGPHREHWTFEERMLLLRTVMSIPRQLHLPIHLGMVRRTATAPTPPGVSNEQFQHMIAFYICASRANEYAVKERGDDVRIAAIVEDLPEMRRSLSMVGEMLREVSITIPENCVRPTQEEQATGRITQTRIIRGPNLGSVTYVGKREDPILQLADACAFAFRRYFAELKYGDEFVRAMIGRDLSMDDYAGPGSAATFI